MWQVERPTSMSSCYYSNTKQAAIFWINFTCFIGITSYKHNTMTLKIARYFLWWVYIHAFVTFFTLFKRNLIISCVNGAVEENIARKPAQLRVSNKFFESTCSPLTLTQPRGGQRPNPSLSEKRPMPSSETTIGWIYLYD